MTEGLFLLGAAMPDLSVVQYNMVDNIFSMTVATMGAAALFLFMSRAHVDAEYRPALLVSGLVVSIACYHYFMIRHSWHDAYMLTGGGYKGTGAAFNDFYRYADWILTVPLLMVELVAVLRLPAAKATNLLTRLVIAAALMIALGYPGEVIADPARWSERVMWGALSSIPFFYILYVLWTELTNSLETQPPAAAWMLQGWAASRHTGLRRRVLLADNALVASLVVLLAVASPLVSFPIYFCGWHSMRGLARLRRELGESWPELARSLAPLTVGAIALIGLAAWLVLGGAGWNGTLIRATFVGLSAVAVPHLLLHGVAPLCAASARRRTQSLHSKPRMTLGSPG